MWNIFKGLLQNSVLLDEGNRKEKNSDTSSASYTKAKNGKKTELWSMRSA